MKRVSLAAQDTSEGRFRTAGDASPVGFALYHPVRDPSLAIIDFECAYVNGAGARLFGRAHEAMTGARLSTLEPGAEAQGKLAAFVRVMETGEPEENDFRHRSDGGDLTLHLTIVRAGTALAVTFADVTEWRRAQVELEELRDHVARAERRAARILEQVSDAHVTLDREFRVISANPAAERALGKLQGELAGRSYREALPAAAEAGTAYERVVTEGVELHFTHRSVALDREAHLEVDAYPTDEGGIAIVWRDITERVAAEEFRREFTSHLASWNAQLQAAITERDHLLVERERLLAAERSARSDAEAANRSKGEFLASMSHELRTPLNAIDGYASLIEMGIRGPVTPEQLEDLGRIRRSQRHLMGLINEVLNFVRVDTGTIRFEDREVSVREAVCQAESLVEPMVRAKGLALVMGECPEPVSAHADPEKLQQVLVNLLSNAVKFTDRGGTITCAWDSTAEHVTIAISDTGIGIPADQTSRIFEPFVQAHSGLSRSREGLGLGLAISRNLARGMGGNLTVASEVGVGSTFTVTLRGA